MILLIDNYDSFVYNIARYFEQLGQTTHVVRNDAIDANAVRAAKPDLIVLSPGPCTPREAGCSLDVVRACHADFPLLGICLGHQTIAAAFGAQIVRAPTLMHGRASSIHHDGRGAFAGLPQPFTACRYHSLVVDEGTLPPELEPTARTEDGVLMAFRHRDLPIEGWQFHPESVLTRDGYRLLANLLVEFGIARSRAASELFPSPLAESPASDSPPPASQNPVTF